MILKNPIKYIVAGIIAVLALIPPVKIQLACTVNTTVWLWCVLIGGFLGFFLLYSKINIWLKFLVIFSYISCFTSAAPYLSFTLFWSVLASVFFYMMCLQVKDWTPVMRIVQSLFCLTLLLIIMQQFQSDTLLNFNKKAAVFFGTIHNPMMLASFIVCLSPFLLLHNKLNIIPIVAALLLSKSSGAIFSIAAGLFFYMSLTVKSKTKKIAVLLLIAILCFAYTYKDGKFQAFNKIERRGPIWARALKASAVHPIMGYGIGTFQVVFPVLAEGIMTSHPGPWTYEWTEGDWIAWRKAHNCWLQILFETGLIGLFLFLGFVCTLFFKLWRHSKIETTAMPLTGLVILGVNMTVHFPSRMLQTVIVMIAYLAFCKVISCQSWRYKSVEERYAVT